MYDASQETWLKMKGANNYRLIQATANQISVKVS